MAASGGKVLRRWRLQGARPSGFGGFRAEVLRRWRFQGARPQTLAAPRGEALRRCLSVFFFHKPHYPRVFPVQCTKLASVNPTKI